MESDSYKIPDRAKRMMTTQGFIDLWWEEKKKGISGAKAYRNLEKEFFEYFGFNKYSGYNSFYQIFHRKNANSTA